MPFDPNKWSIAENDIDPLIKKIADKRYVESLSVIFKTLLKNRMQFPSLYFKETPDIRDYIQKWIDVYFKGFDGRPSKRSGKPSGTIPDSLIKDIYAMRHKQVTKEQLEMIAQGHATMMTLEKVVGDLLEEYLCEELSSFGWHCCWGQTVKAADFCHENGTLLQIKTSDNSENSSSRSVRTDTNIEVWQRRKSKKRDEYYWEDLIDRTGNPKLSEANFRTFIGKLLEGNPNCIYVEEPAKSEEPPAQEEK